MRVTRGDIFKSESDIIVQQINCLTTRSHGLSKDIAATYPYADVYADRDPLKPGVNQCKPGCRGKPGTIVVSVPPAESPASSPIVVSITGQWSCGVPGRYYKYIRAPDERTDDYPTREFWFRTGLAAFELYLKESMVSGRKYRIGVPYKIGCGYAGGNWSHYREMLNRFTENVTAIPDADIIVTLYRKD